MLVGFGGRKLFRFRSYLLPLGVRSRCQGSLLVLCVYSFHLLRPHPLREWRRVQSLEFIRVSKLSSNKEFPTKLDCTPPVGDWREISSKEIHTPATRIISKPSMGIIIMTSNTNSREGIMRKCSLTLVKYSHSQISKLNSTPNSCNSSCP